MLVQFSLLSVFFFGVSGVLGAAPPFKASPQAIVKGSTPNSAILASVPLVNRVWAPTPQIAAKFTGSTPDVTAVNFDFNLNKNGFNVLTNDEVKDMTCVGDTINLNIPNATALDISGTWETPFAVLTPAKWPCNGKGVNQFFTANSIKVDQASKILSLKVTPAKITDHAQIIDWNLSAPVQTSGNKKRLFQVILVSMLRVRSIF